MNKLDNFDQKENGLLHYLFSFIGLIMCVIFGSVLLCNITLIVQGAITPEMPPSILGKTPLVVMSGSMSGFQEGHLEVGDLIIIDKIDADKLQVGDVITYMLEDSTTAVTHRIIRIEPTDSGLTFITQGDANNVEDNEPVNESQIVGIVIKRIPRLGDFVIFLQEPIGMFLFIGVPVIIFIILDIIKRRKDSNRQADKTAELEAEIAKLKELAAKEN